MDVQQFVRDPVLIVLALASLVSWTIIVERALAVARARRHDRLFQAGDRHAEAPLAALRRELERTVELEQEHRLTALDTAIVMQRQRLEHGLPLLGVIGSTAPYVGLLGTVIGIIQAFVSIQTQNNMTPSVVAGGISAALVATATGLAVAIPAVAAHHLFVSTIARQAAAWEAVVVTWLAEAAVRREGSHESVPQA